MSDFRQEYLADMRTQFAKLRSTAERAMAQVGDHDFAKMLDTENNSIAITVKHISGNLRSRCTDFLTSDGEAPWPLGVPCRADRTLGKTLGRE
jgi:hypothetical protein